MSVSREAREEAIARLIDEAVAARKAGDSDLEETALIRALDLEPAHLATVLLRAQNLASKGDRRAATTFFKSGLAIARRGGVSPDLRALLDFGTRYLNESIQLYRKSLAEAVSKHRHAGLRFQHCVEMLDGSRAVFVQQPSALYVPYLPQRQFFERDEFPWSAGLEKKTEAIQRELRALLDSRAEFLPYVEHHKDRPAQDFFGLHGDPSWSAFYLYRNGELVSENADRCPETIGALSDVPLSRIGDRTPSVFFSLLRPGAHIPPHHGMLNCRLICHLPLVVPNDCWLRVGNETRHLQSGKMMIFDDSLEHEAKNGSDQLRVVLIFDIWRPELSEPERAGISAIFRAIDQFSTLTFE